MDAASHLEPAAGSARLLLALRHAMADPLSTAALKIDLIERRITAPSGADPSWVTERLRAVQTEIFTANRLLDLLLRLAEIAEEEPEETSISDLCRAAGVPVDPTSATLPRLCLRPRASAEALLNVASFAAPGDRGADWGAQAGTSGGRVTLSVAGPRVTPDARPERLLDLPHGEKDAEALFVARAAVEADGGRLSLVERGPLLVALFSWPVAQGGAGA